MNTIKNMRIFMTVVASGGFSPAAKRMRVSASRVSRAISELENYLQARLLNRSTRTFMLTEAGEKYLERCKTIMKWLDSAEAEARGAIEDPTGTLRVCAQLGFGQSESVSTVLRFREKHPSIDVDLVLSDAPLHLIDGGYDTALVLAPALPDSDMVAHTLGAVAAVACASPEYVRCHGAPRNLDDLARHTCLRMVTPHMPTGTWTLAGKEALDRIRDLPVRLSFNHESALLAAMQEGFGIGVLPAASALPALQRGELVCVLQDVKLSALNLYVIYPSRQFIDAKTRAWVEFLKHEIPLALADSHDRFAEVSERPLEQVVPATSSRFD
ncbi:MULTISPECIES: LysR family transcriptional regulator [Burkholderia]|uniref:LysR family transcriptional regulator n=1 Tax=Burkholderia paludis TaxID=1506587 RepID=A0A6P2QWR6_9BURK|nr:MULTISPECIES: LysR family transcriptional regulator [Burkholderia]CAB3771545.1 HTH-type transcriptional regulator DmlR [Burkholderia paludis]VWC28403.1 LysR family transcriptional regulator [Burkholderia paludis]